MATIDDFAALVPVDHGLVTVATTRADGTVQATVVNVGVLPHPVSGERVVGLVARGSSAKLTNLRARPRATVTIRGGWQWVTVEGPVTLIGPDDPLAGIDEERLRALLREVFVAAGGVHDDWPDYDETMARERRSVVLVTPERVYSNP
jgi:PPOX class probable F420-dependent enzyme